MENHDVNVQREGQSVRILARQLGRVLNDDELDAVAGGTVTCTCCSGGDCDGHPDF